jgi:hypothetical protein
LACVWRYVFGMSHTWDWNYWWVIFKEEHHVFFMYFLLYIICGSSNMSGNCLYTVFQWITIIAGQ